MADAQTPYTPVFGNGPYTGGYTTAPQPATSAPAAQPSVAPVQSPQPAATPSILNPTGAPQKSDFWGNLGVGGYSALNELGFGAPDALAKIVAGSTNYQALQDWRNQHSAANLAGGLAGDIGGMFIPGLDVVKGGEMAARGLGLAKTADVLAHVQDIAHGTGLAAGLVSGASQAIPRAITSAISTGDVGQAAGQAVLGTGLGGALGAVGGILAKEAPQAAEVVGNELNKTINATAGVTSKIERSVLNKGADLSGVNIVGSGINHMEDFNSQLAKTVTDNNLFSPAAEKAYVQAIPAKYAPFSQAYSDAVSQNPQLVSTLADVQDPAIQKILISSGVTDPAAQQALVTKVAGGADAVAAHALAQGGAPWEATRGFLQDIAQLPESQDWTANATSDIAQALRQKVTDQAATLASSTPGAGSLTDLLHQYPADEAIKQAVYREGTTLTKPVEKNSTTFEKILMSHLAMGGLGAGIGAADQDEGGGLDLGNMAIGAAVGGTLGPVAGRLITGAGNAITGRAAGLLSKALPAGIENIGNFASNPAVQQVLGRAAGMAPTIGNEVGNAQQAQIQQPQPAGMAPAQQPQSISAQTLMKAQQIAGVVQSAPPQVQQQAQSQFTQAYGDRISQSLHDTYQRSYGVYNPQGVTEQQFMQQTQQLTNNFDISNPYTAAVLFPGDAGAQSKFLDAAKTYVQMKSIGLNTALDQSPLTLGVRSKVPPMLLSSSDNQKVMAYNTLRDSLTKLAGGNKAAASDVQNKLYRIMSMNVPVQEKQKMVWQAAQEAGMPLDLLQSVGINPEGE